MRACVCVCVGGCEWIDSQIQIIQIVFTQKQTFEYAHMHTLIDATASTESDMDRHLVIYHNTALISPPLPPPCDIHRFVRCMLMQV